MDSVVILIAAPGSQAISPAIARSVGGVAAGKPRWLHEGEAVEFPALSFSAGQRAGIDKLVKDQPIDVAVLPPENRRKRFLIADMDSTMIGQECIDELGALAGVGERIREITARAMKGELDFEGALRARLGLVKGLPESMIGRIISERITFTGGGRTLVATMKANGAYAALVSGGFVQFTGHVAKELGFDEHRANELIIEQGMLMGAVREPMLGKGAKVSALHEIAQRLGISLADTLAVGDGANDIPMLKDAGLGVALHAKPKVQEAVPVSINHGDLTALLYLQGYQRSEFVS
jgi:phosphoserine phosphatase